MSKPIVITADSTVDLSEDLIERYGIRTIPLTILLGDDTFLDGQGYSTLDMYARYRLDGTLPKTAASGVQDFIEFFTPFVEAGCEVVHLDISSELSVSFNNARLAAEELGNAGILFHHDGSSFLFIVFVYLPLTWNLCAFFSVVKDIFF